MVIDIILVIVIIGLIIYVLNLKKKLQSTNIVMINGLLVIKKGKNPEKIEVGDLLIGKEKDKVIIKELNNTPNTSNNFSYYFSNGKTKNL